MIVSESANQGYRAVSLRDRLDLLLRQKLFVGAIFGAFLVLGILASALAPARYVAEATVALDARKVQVIAQDAVVSRLPSDSPVLRTELDLINSRTMAERVVERLHLTNPQELEGSAGFFGGLRGIFRKSAIVGPDSAKNNAEIVSRLLSGLRATNDGRSYTIFISFTANSPELAAKIANGFADAYLDYQVDIQVAATRGAGEWLGKKLQDLRGTLETSELAVQTHRYQAGLLEQNGQSLQSLRVNALNNELAVARSARAGAEARAKTAEELSKSPAGLSAFPEILGSTVIQQLRRDQMQITRTISDLEETGATLSPQIPALRSQLASIDRQIAEEIDRVLKSLNNEVQIAKQKEKELEDAFDRLGAEISQSDQAIVQLRHLERDAAANRAIYETFLTRFKQTMEQEGLAAPEARIISRAENGSRTTSTGLSYLIFSIAAGAVLAIGAAFVRARLDDRIWSSAALEDTTKIPLLGSLPEMRPWWPLHNKSPEEEITIRDIALRKIEATLRLFQGTSRAKVIMITSAIAQEGKTSFCTDLARTMARLGRRVIVVDADTYRPGVGSMLEDDYQEFRDQSSVVKTTQKMRVEHLSLTADVFGDLGTEKLRDLFATLKPKYDMILIDTPPILVSTEAAFIGGFADATLFIARWGWTSLEAITLALRQLAQCNISVGGIVLNRVDASRHAHYENSSFDAKQKQPGQSPYQQAVILPVRSREALDTVRKVASDLRRTMQS